MPHPVAFMVGNPPPTSCLLCSARGCAFTWLQKSKIKVIKFWHVQTDFFFSLRTKTATAQAAWFFGHPVFEVNRDLAVIYYSAWHRRHPDAGPKEKRRKEMSLHQSLQNFFKSNSLYHFLVQFNFENVITKKETRDSFKALFVGYIDHFGRDSWTGKALSLVLFDSVSTAAINQD